MSVAGQTFVDRRSLTEKDVQEEGLRKWDRKVQTIQKDIREKKEEKEERGEERVQYQG